MAYRPGGILVLAACFLGGVVISSNVTLTPTKDIVLENSTITLTCSRSDGGIIESQWTTSLHTGTAGCAKTSTACITTSFLSNTSLYDCICNGNGTYSVLLKRVDRYYDSATWSCRALSSAESNTVILRLAVPVSSVMLRVTDVEPTYENSTVTFLCITSYGLPAADIHWYRNNDSSTVELIKNTYIDVDITRNVTEREDNTVCVEETLNYKVDRSVHGWSIYCTANNWKDNTVVSNKSELSVIYDDNSSALLTQSTDVVPENSTLTLTCSKSDENLVETVWKTSLHTEEANCAKTSTGCITTSFLSNTSLYDCICNEDGTFSVLLKRVDRYYDGASWNCSEISHTESNTITLNVSVPISLTVLRVTDVEPIAENATTLFSCITSYGLPAAKIHWYRNKDLDTIELSRNADIDVDITRNVTERYDSLVSVEETLNYKVDRSVHGWSIYCTANNWKDNTVISNKSELSVIYPPGRPPVIHSFTNGSKYFVIEATRASLSCSVEGGNPHGKPIWSCGNNNNYILIESHSDGNIVTSNITWIAIRSQDDTCKCQTDHELSDVYVYVIIEVLYPADLKHELSNVSVAEGDNFTLACPVTVGNPADTIISWTRDDGQNVTNNNVLRIPAVRREDDHIYMCTVFNEMKPSGGSVTKYPKRDQFHLNVFFEANVTSLSANRITSSTGVNLNIGESLSIQCIVEGNPNADITLTMAYRLNQTVFGGTILQYNVEDVTFSNSGIYICTGRNNYSQAWPYRREIAVLVKEVTTERSDMTGALIGSSVAAGVVVVGLFLNLLLFRKRCQKRAERCKQNDDTIELQTITDECPIELGKQYDFITPSEERAVTEMQENNYESIKTVKDAVDGTSATYTNLSLQ